MVGQKRDPECPQRNSSPAIVNCYFRISKFEDGCKPIARTRFENDPLHDVGAAFSPWHSPHDTGPGFRFTQKLSSGKWGWVLWESHVSRLSAGGCVFFPRAPSGGSTKSRHN